MFQEINLSDKTLRQQFINYWEQGDYSSAYAILENSQLNKKAVLAEIFNDLTEEIYDLETTTDPTFKADRIKVADVAPSGLANGDVYFQIV